MKKETAAKLNTLSPIMVEPMPLSLEEVFLDEMEGTNYDFYKILLKTLSALHIAQVLKATLP